MSFASRLGSSTASTRRDVMAYRFRGLNPEPFRQLYGMSDADLAACGARRHVVDAVPGFPDRIELRDLAIGEIAILLNYTHQPMPTPYRAAHAIFVREGAQAAAAVVDQVPEVIRRRTISLRAFDGSGDMIDAALAEGEAIEAVIERMLADPVTAYLHAHYAVRGCYAALVERS